MVFETFLLNGSTKLTFLNCFELVPPRPLDRHPTSHRLKHFQISYFQGESKFFISPEGNPKLPNGCDFLAKTSSNWSYQNILGDTEVFTIYTPPYTNIQALAIPASCIHVYIHHAYTEHTYMHHAHLYHAYIHHRYMYHIYKYMHQVFMHHTYTHHAYMCHGYKNYEYVHHGYVHHVKGRR